MSARRLWGPQDVAGAPTTPLLALFVDPVMLAVYGVLALGAGAVGLYLLDTTVTVRHGVATSTLGGAHNGLQTVCRVLVPVGVALLGLAVTWRLARGPRRPPRLDYRRSRHETATGLIAELPRRPARAGITPADLDGLREALADAGAGAWLGLRDRRRAVFAQHNSAVLVLGGPRTGKTQAIIMATVVLAPGPVVVTSTKAEVAVATAAARRTLGPGYLLDPAGVAADLPGLTRLGWTPVPARPDLDHATMLAGQLVFASGHTPGEGSHFDERAAHLLAALLHAASLGEHAIGDLRSWVDRRDMAEPAAALEAAAHKGEAGAALAIDRIFGFGQALARDDREALSVLATLSRALAPWGTLAGARTAELPRLDPAEFVAGAGTLYAICPEDLGALYAPILAGLVTEISKARYRAHAAGHTGPHLTLALDELANIAPLRTYPKMISEAGGQGIHVLGVFQNMAQADARWGTAARGFLSAHTVRVLFAGQVDDRTLRELAAVAGHYDQRILSRSHRGTGGPAGISETWRRVPVLTTGDLAELPADHLYVQNGSKWELLQTTYWHDHLLWTQLHDTDTDDAAAPAVAVPPRPAAPAPTIQPGLTSAGGHR